MKGIKKLLCVLLCTLMVTTSCFMLASGEDGSDKEFDFEQEALDTLDAFLGGYSLDSYDIPNFADINFDELIASGALNEVNLGGMTLDELYNSTDPIKWENMSIDSSIIYLAMGNLNLYLKNLMNKYYTNEVMYSSRNASLLANKLCDVFFGPNHQEIIVTLDSEEKGQQLPFIRAVLRGAKSGITSVVQLIQANWIDRGINYLPMVYALGVDLDDIWNKNSAQEVVEESLMALINNFIDNPLYTVMDIIWAVCRAYNSYMNVPIRASFETRINAGEITEDEIGQPHNVLNLLFNGNNKTHNGVQLQFLTAPYIRMGRAADRVELFYYLMVYAMLIGNYGRNDEVIDIYEQKVQAYNYVPLPQKDKDYICDLLDGFTSGNLNGVITFTTSTAVDNVKDNVNSFFQKIVKRIQEILEELIAFFDNIFGFKDKWT